MVVTDSFDPALLDPLMDTLGLTVSQSQVAQLQTYAEFLGSEGIATGGIGPHEGSRLFDRHIADSLAFLAVIPPEATVVVDVGSGVGLPGIPVAIALPDTEVRLIDRSQRRTDLARRAVRILGIGNVDAVNTDVGSVAGPFDSALFRASLGLGQAATVTQRLVASGGCGVFAVSRLAVPPTIPEAPVGLRYDLVNPVGEVLDSPAWLLRMTPI